MGVIMEGLFLILHKVRGEVAYDVAQRWLLGCGKEIWLIPTSGHRAYPLEYKPLAPMLAGMTGNDADWDALPDHYRPREPRGPLAMLKAPWRRITSA